MNSILPPWITSIVALVVNVWILYPSTSVTVPPEIITLGVLLGVGVGLLVLVGVCVGVSVFVGV
jgi:hypothetical protein